MTKRPKAQPSVLIYTWACRLEITDKTGTTYETVTVSGCPDLLSAAEAVTKQFSRKLPGSTCRPVLLFRKD